jgi:hypothetical protein
VTAIPELCARHRIPELAAADLTVDLTLLAAPCPAAPLSAFRSWQRDRDAAVRRMRGVQARFAPLLCRFCAGFATVADLPCQLCEASGFSRQGRETFRSHHNGE